MIFFHELIDSFSFSFYLYKNNGGKLSAHPGKLTTVQHLVQDEKTRQKREHGFRAH